MAIFSPLAWGTRYFCFCSSVPQHHEGHAVEADVHGHDHAQVGVDVLQLLGHEAEADVVHARRRRTPRGCRSRAGAGRPCPSGTPRSKRCSRSRSWIFGATSRAAQSRTAFSTSLWLSSSSNESIELVLGVVRRIPTPRPRAAAGPGRGRGGPRPPASCGTRTRTTANERTLGSGSWLKRLVDDLGLDARLAQPQRHQLGLEDLRRLGHLSQPPCEPPRPRARRRHQRSFQTGLRLPMTAFSPSSASSVRHQLVQVDVLGVAEGVRQQQVERRRPARAG